MIMGIVRLWKVESTGCCEAKVLSSKKTGEPAAHELTILHKNDLWNDILKAVPAHSDEHLPGRCKHPAANRRETG